MLLSSFRYAIGRRSYFVSEVIDMFNKYKSDLEDWQVKQIIEEVKIEFNLCVETRTLLGDALNHREWEKFIKDNA